MAFRNLILESKAYVSLKNGQLGALMQADEPFQAEQLTIF